MYRDVLSDALRVSRNDLGGQALVDHVVDARVAMLSSRIGSAPSAAELLTAEIAYDVSLIRLCDDFGVAIDVAAFADPLMGRVGIERELAESHGLDLTALTRARFT